GLLGIRTAEQDTMSDRKVGIWIVGACGSVATCAVTGAEALKAGIIPTSGLVTELSDFKDRFVWLLRVTERECTTGLRKEHGKETASGIWRQISGFGRSKSGW
ncbi:MAG TPA: hypothetical protein VLL05_01930, partial [Terriglobales bacterium]|nr:hypothetical protein [Terriglobales bacterium]